MKTKKIAKRLTAAALTAAFMVSASTAAMAGEWKEDTNGWWYQEDDSTYPANAWKEIDGKWYYFDQNGYMRRGWVQDGSTWYFLGADGSMSTNQVVEGYQLAADGSRIDERNQLGIYIKEKTTEKNTTAANGEVVMECKVSVPLVTIAGNQDATNKINSYFNEVKNNIEADRAAHEAEAVGYYNMAGQANGVHYETQYSFEALGTTKNYISFRLDRYDYTGGAHGYTQTTLVSFDPATGEVIKLDDMAIAPDSMKEKILNNAAKQITAAYSEVTEDIVKNAGIEQWCVVDGGLKLLYNQYNIACYAAGQIEVTVPYKEYSMYTNEYGRELSKGN